MDIESLEQIRILGSSLRVLYVEDEPSIQEEVHKMLARIFIDIDLAQDGENAWELYKKNNYDLVLTDLEMPKLNGIDLSHKIMNYNKEQNIIIISAHKNTNQLLELLDLGVSGLILKPINIENFLTKIALKVKEIYANKMMKIQYEKMKKDLKEHTKTHFELQKKDPVTSLYNYSYLKECLKNDKNQVAILLNIQEFKLINEYYSYNHGNHLLFQVASKLMQEAKKYNFDVFRLSGDEFLLLYKTENILCQNVHDDAQAIVANLEKKKYNVIGIKDIHIALTASYACSKDRLLEELTIALEYGKKCSSPIMSYEDSVSFKKDIKHIIEVRTILQNAIENNQVVPVYQPIVMFDHQTKFEVLMRIEDHDTLLTPDKFLKIAKAHNYYHEISKMLIFKSLEEISHRDENFSINLTYMDIANKSFMDTLEAKILGYNVAQRVIFEITESDILDDMDIVDKFIKRFRHHGVKIAIDDFGSGYSNFAYIIKLNPDFLKIDGSLIENIISDTKKYILVKSIIDLAHNLDIEVIAEFVSSKEIYDALNALGVDAMQGYYLGKPKKGL